VNKLLIFIAATIGGSLGWWLGSFVGIMAAFFVSVVGTAAGVFVAHRYISSNFS